MSEEEKQTIELATGIFVAIAILATLARIMLNV
jgi:hypothetical protein